MISDFSSKYFAKMKGPTEMRVCLLFNHGHIHGGGEISFLDLIDELKNRVDPFVLVPVKGQIRERLESDGISVCTISFPRFRIRTLHLCILSIVKLVRWLNRNKIDVMHANGARCMLYAGIASLLTRTPSIWHVRVVARDRVLDRFRAFCSSGIIANSRTVAEMLKPIVHRKAINVIYNGFDITALENTLPSDLKQLFNINHTNVVTFVGRLSPEKRIEDLLSACGMLCGAVGNLHCLIVGSVPQGVDINYGEYLKRFAHEQGVEQITFAGWRDDIISLIKASAVLCLPAIGESFGRVIIEAWACGVPVIAADNCGPRELITHDRDGSLVPVRNPARLADAIRDCLCDLDRRARYIREGRNRALQFSLSQCARQVYEIYSEVCANS